MSPLSRTARRRNVAIRGAKIMVTASAVITTIAGWAALSAADPNLETTAVAQLVTPAAATATPAATTTALPTTASGFDSAATVAPAATFAPTPTQAPLPTQRVRIRTRSSR